MFLTIWDNFGPIWTLLGLFRQKSSCCPIRTKSGFTEVLLSKTSFFCLKWFKRVQTGPKKVPNGQKQFGWPFQTLLDSFGPLWNVDKPAMFGPFCLSYWCVFFGTPCSLVYPYEQPSLICRSIVWPVAIFRQMWQYCKNKIVHKL